MRRARIVVALAIGGLAACLPLLPLPAQPAPKGGDVLQRFGAVREYTGTVTVSFSHSAMQDPSGLNPIFRGSEQWLLTADVTLRQTKDLIGWKGDGDAQFGIKRETTHGIPTLQYRTSTRGSGQSKLAGKDFLDHPAEPTLGIVDVDKYFLSLGVPTIEVDDWWTRSDTGEVKRGRPRVALSVILKDLPLPQAGLRLQGRKEIPVGHDGGVTLIEGIPDLLDWATLWDQARPPKATVTWDLYPRNEELELVVEKPKNYDEWLPKGGKDEATPAPGNDITFVANLRKKGGGDPEMKATKIRFELIQTSREPGVCMNWPPPDRLATGPMFDLKFDPPRNPGLPPLGPVYGQMIATPEGEHTKATAVISSFDWGGWSMLRVVAEMPGGLSPVVGYLAGDPQQVFIPLPKRQPNSKVADSWKKDKNVPDRSDYDDGERGPEGNDHKGDGLSLYEEYRGFHKNNQHIYGDPTVKDFFIRDEIGTVGTKQGISTFARVTKMKVHHELRADEMDEKDRVINRNHGHAHRVDQHGIRLTEGDPGFFGGLVVNEWTDETNLCTENTRPGLPREIKKIIIHSGLVTDSSRQKTHEITVAHELLHSVNVKHHGDTDVGMVRWWVEERNGKLQILEVPLLSRKGPDGKCEHWYDPKTIAPIQVYDAVRELPPQHALFRKPRDYWLAVKGGQHSGDSRCLMCYDAADAVVTNDIGNEPTRRVILLDRDVANRLCTGRRGSELFGDATRGNCTAQICVSDLGP